MSNNTKLTMLLVVPLVIIVFLLIILLTGEHTRKQKLLDNDRYYDIIKGDKDVRILSVKKSSRFGCPDIYVIEYDGHVLVGTENGLVRIPRENGDEDHE